MQLSIQWLYFMSFFFMWFYFICCFITIKRCWFQLSFCCWELLMDCWRRNRSYVLALVWSWSSLSELSMQLFSADFCSYFQWRMVFILCFWDSWYFIFRCFYQSLALRCRWRLQIFQNQREEFLRRDEALLTVRLGSCDTRDLARGVIEHILEVIILRYQSMVQEGNQGVILYWVIKRAIYFWHLSRVILINNNDIGNGLNRQGGLDGSANEILKYLSSGLDSLLLLGGEGSLGRGSVLPVLH